MTRLQAISRFSPGNCDPQFLESITVGREELLRALEKAVSSSVRSGAGHHWLIVGQRGAGKTHLVALLRDRVQRDEKLRKRVVIAYLKEEERGVAHFLDWLVRILQSFVRHDEAGPELTRDIEQLMDMEHEAAQAAAEQLLIRFVGKRRLLLLVENLGEIFSSKKGMGREGQQRFRDLVQQHPVWTIIATTQALFDDVQTRDAPFYGFFKIHHLQSFDFEQAVSLLDKLAEAEQRPKLRAFLRSAPARGRIRAVHTLTRGSPRLLIVFYQFIDSDSVEELSRSFLDMIDSLTSYYQERMNALSAGQQKIVEILCSQRTPMTVKQIARSCFISQSSASSELKRLADMRYVTSHRAGRESYYEISEPLFRICFEVKENRGYPVRLFVDFLGTYYTAEELERKYRSAYLLSALYKSQGFGKEERSERERLHYISQAALVHHEIDFIQATAVAGEPGSDPELLPGLLHDFLAHADHREVARLADAALAMKIGNAEFLRYSARAHRELGDLDVAGSRIEALLRTAPGDSSTWIERAQLAVAGHDLDGAIESYRRALEIEPEHVDALFELGWVLLQSARFGTASFELVAMNAARLERIVTKGTGVSKEAIAKHLFRRIENVAAARDVFARVCRLEPDAWEPWVVLGEVHLALAEGELARTAAQKACDLAPREPRCWQLVGRVAFAQGEHHVAVEHLTRAVTLDPTAADGWLVLAQAHRELKDLDAALKSARRAIECSPDRVDLQLFGAELAFAQGLYEEASQRFDNLVERQQARLTAYVLAAPMYLESKQYEYGLRLLDRLVARGFSENEETVTFFVGFTISMLLRRTPLEHLPRFLDQQHAAFAAAGQTNVFVLSAFSALKHLVTRHGDVSLERLDALCTMFLAYLERHQQPLGALIRLIATMLRYLREKDERILLELPLEERQVLLEMLAPPAEAAPSASR